MNPPLYFTACIALLQNLAGNSCLRRSTAGKEAEQQAEASGDVPLQIVISTPFCFFPLSAPSLNFPFLTIPFSSDQLSVLLDKDFKFHSVS